MFRTANPYAAAISNPFMSGFNDVAQLQNALLQNQYYGPQAQAAIDYQNANTNKLNTMTPLEAQQMQISNQYLPDKLRLANELARLTNQNYVPNIQSEIDLRNAQRDEINALLPTDKKIAELKANYPLMGQPGAAGQVGAQLYLNDVNRKLQQQQQNQNAFVSTSLGNLPYTPINNALSNVGMPNNIPQAANQLGYGNTIMDALNAKTQGQVAKAQLAQMQAGNYNWSQMPVEARNTLIAQGAGAGLDPTQMRDRINKGMTMRQIYEEQGLDPDHPPAPIYPLTTASKTQNQKTAAVSQELEYLNSAANQFIKPYAQRFMGYSAQELKDQFSKDPEVQKQYGRYLAAQAIMNEIANGRLNLAGARSSVQLARDLAKKSQAGFKEQMNINMTPEIYEEMQKTIEQLLNKGAKIRTRYGLQQFGNNPNQGKTDNKDLANMSDEELIQIARKG